MKWLKILVLLLAVLAAMRVGSWTVEWCIEKLTVLPAKFVAIVGNLIGLGVFAVLLLRDQLPGEPLDMSALVFGVIVFGVCCWTDLHWRPWKTTR
ncbi:MAG: hypothetical protein U0Q18_18285 [Bryobacteraceae bacterium]